MSTEFSSLGGFLHENVSPESPWKRFCDFSFLALSIILSGWIALAFYVVAIYESSAGMSFLHEFLSTQENGLRYRALLLYTPFITTVFGYLVHMREKNHARTGATIRRLDRSNRLLTEAVQVLRKERADRLEASEARALCEKQYRLLADNISDVLFIMSEDIRMEYVSPSVSELLGYEPAELTGKQKHRVLTKTGLVRAVRTLRQELRYYRRTGKVRVKTVEVEFIHKDGSPLLCETRARVLPPEPGKPLCVVGVMRDVTASKLLEQELREAGKYNEVLLKEVNHRAKNSLMIILTMLKLEADRSDDPAIQKVLRGSENRILALGTLHDRLCQHESGTSVDAGEYFGYLANMLHESFKDKSPNVVLELEMQKVTLDVEYAGPCGFILVELLTNAFQHAFPSCGQGTVCAGFKRAQDGNFLLYVRDTGQGMPEVDSSSLPQSLGMRIVKSLVNQLGATLSVTREKGTEFLITFSEKKIR